MVRMIERSTIKNKAGFDFLYALFQDKVTESKTMLGIAKIKYIPSFLSPHHQLNMFIEEYCRRWPYTRLINN